MIPQLYSGNQEETAIRSRATNTVQSVIRALGLLEALNRRAVNSVEQLHVDTGLPKPTIIRILKTLIQAGFVAHDRRQSGYQVTAAVHSLSCGYHSTPLIVEASRPWAASFTREYKWPVAIAVLDVDAVTIRFSTIFDSPISPFHASLNRRLSLFTSALGFAYFAFCPKTEQKTLLKLALQAGNEPILKSKNDGWLRLRIRQAVERGYTDRDPSAKYKESATIAVPIFIGDHVAATFGMTYFKTAVKPAEIVNYVAALQSAAKSIEKQMKSLRFM